MTAALRGEELEGHLYKKKKPQDSFILIGHCCVSATQTYEQTLAWKTPCHPEIDRDIAAKLP